jgi:hypothetical protein
MPVNAVMPEREPAVAKATTAEYRRGPEPAAMEYGATASETTTVKDRAATVEPAMETSTATAVETSTTTAVVTATASPTAMAAADCGRQPVRDGFRRGSSARIDQRQRLCALARHRRQRKDRGGRKAQRTDKATDNAAPGIWNLYHA